MHHALQLAKKAYQMGEVPVGCVLVKEGRIIAEGWNHPINQHDPSAHAEVMTIRAAGQQLKNYRLPDTTLYVTLEPCTMCAGLMIHARIKRLVFGANEPKTGACGSVFNVLGDERHNHQLEVAGGVMQGECVAIIKRFFAERRLLKKHL
ncbi:MAG TPA: tRNA adenosine(34) deaminase TadA [Thiothrix sp.]|nr:tRNA adenosine(34) deaminase TadA [Thiothrix sp.]